MSGVCVELRRRPPPQRGERKNGPKTAPLRHDRLHHPLKQSPKLSNSRILRGSLNALVGRRSSKIAAKFQPRRVRWYGVATQRGVCEQLNGVRLGRRRTIRKRFEGGRLTSRLSLHYLQRLSARGAAGRRRDSETRQSRHVDRRDSGRSGMTRARKLIASFDAHTLATVSGIYSHTLCARQVSDGSTSRRRNPARR